MPATVENLTRVSEEIVATYDKLGGINRIDGTNIPTFPHVISILDDYMELMFPGYFSEHVPARSNLLFYVQSSVDSIYMRLCEEFSRACQFICKLENCENKFCDMASEDSALELVKALPSIRAKLKMDVHAGLDGDPASQNIEEIISCYPYIYAIATHRFAHEIYKMNIPLVPRMMSEWAHRRTGIDIHPGATIGDRFFIDHGSGVVIGETAEIGNDVKIYQGVTLGAISFKRNGDGTIVKGGKRHPTIKDGVTIYAGATILGGETTIGENCVIGANTWITSSVPENTLVTFQEQQRYRKIEG